MRLTFAPSPAVDAAVEASKDPLHMFLKLQATQDVVPPNQSYIDWTETQKIGLGLGSAELTFVYAQAERSVVMAAHCEIPPPAESDRGDWKRKCVDETKVEYHVTVYKDCQNEGNTGEQPTEGRGGS